MSGVIAVAEKGGRTYSGYNQETLQAMLLYSVCSSTLLLVNKLAVNYIPAASFVMLVQLLFSVVLVLVGKWSGYIEVDDFVWSKMKPYCLYVVAFCIGMYANMKALEVSNVETVIVFRSCAPLFVSLLDYSFLGRALPSFKSWAALIVIGIGACLYVLIESDFTLHGFGAYSWTLAYLLIICFQMTYGKQILTHVKTTIWGSVLYTNALSLVPMTILFFTTGDYIQVYTVTFNQFNLTILLLSCVIGCGISYAGWHCRNLVSAATYTLVGVMNKVVTIILNIIIWDKHASVGGLLSLVLCLAGGFFYQQAPLQVDNIAKKGRQPSSTGIV